MVSHIVVVTFDNLHEAADLRHTLRILQKQGLPDVEDGAVIIRDDQGRVKVDNEASHGV